MKTKRVLSFLLNIAILFSICNIGVFANTDEINNENENLPDAAISVPTDSSLYVGVKKTAHFVEFTQIEPYTITQNENEDVYYFELEDNKVYNYRVSGDEHITYVGKFKKTADFRLDITKEKLSAGGKTKTSIDRDTSNNNGYNVADIYLNINPQGYLKLNIGETYQLINLRNWEAIDTVTNNYFFEPDYHYTVIDENGNRDESVIEISNDGIITAKNKGVAIVLVTYDAMNVDFGTGKDFYGAIWPENTGVFVVGVGEKDSNITPNMTINVGKNSVENKLSGDNIDAENDCIYYIGDTGYYTFKPLTEGCQVSVSNPTVDTSVTYTGFNEIVASEDGSFCVPLKTGRNIVKISKDSKSEYQLITAKEVNVTINNGEPVKAGDNLSIVFDRLYHPSNKLAAIYNMHALPIYSSISGYENVLTGGEGVQYTVANNAPTQTIAYFLKPGYIVFAPSYVIDKKNILKVPDDYEYDTFTISNGSVYVAGYGENFGNHRTIELDKGREPNLNAAMQTAYLGILPDIEIPITAPDGELLSISLTTTDVKTEYYAGESFDTENLAVIANYEDGKTQIVTNYTVSPDILTKDTQSVTITYRDKTAQIPVTVIEDKVSAVSIKNNPAKVSYISGETFEPTGMVIEAIYNSGKKSETYDYSYEPKRTLTVDDTQITISYIGTDAEENVAGITVPISVVASAEGGTPSNDKITVYFTLYGDEKHGTPSSESATHTLKKGNLTVWISKMPIEVKSGSYAIDVVEKALGLSGIPYSNPSGNYIDSIKGLGEFDNGSLSGWMYTLNGIHTSNGVAEQTVKNGDRIVFHYTDDYTQEQASDSFSSAIGESTDTKTEDKTENKNQIKTEITLSGDTANVTTSEKNVTDAITDAKKNNESKIIISSGDTNNATDIILEIPANSVKEIADNKDLSLLVETNAGNVAISNEALNAIAQQSGNDEKINVVIATRSVEEIVKNADAISSEKLQNAIIVEVTISSGDTNMSEFDGHSLSIEVPVDSAKYKKGKAYKVYIISADGSVETTFGECTENIGQSYVSVQTKHLSSFAVTDIENAPFTDAMDHWAFDAIEYVYNHSIMQGVSETEFAPNDTMTRAMLVTVLYRLENPIGKTKSQRFADVKDGQWYTDAVAWASENGIAEGISETEFAPYDSITREQMATIMHRYAQFKGKDTSIGEDTNILSFDDAMEISEYAIPAVQWMVGAGLMKGETEATINPQNNSTRAQAATILMKYLEQ